MNRNESVVSSEMTRRSGGEVEGGKRCKEAEVNASTPSSASWRKTGKYITVWKERERKRYEIAI